VLGFGFFTQFSAAVMAEFSSGFNLDPTWRELWQAHQTDLRSGMACAISFTVSKGISAALMRY